MVNLYLTQFGQENLQHPYPFCTHGEVDRVWTRRSLGHASQSFCVFSVDPASHSDSWPTRTHSLLCPLHLLVALLCPLPQSFLSCVCFYPNSSFGNGGSAEGKEARGLTPLPQLMGSIRMVPVARSKCHGAWGPCSGPRSLTRATGNTRARVHPACTTCPISCYMLHACLDTAPRVTSQVTSSRVSSIFNPGLFVTNIGLSTSGSQAAPKFHLVPRRVWTPRERLVSRDVPAATQGNWVNSEGGTEGGGAGRAVPGDPSGSETRHFWAEVFKNQKCLGHDSPHLPGE